MGIVVRNGNYNQVASNNLDEQVKKSIGQVKNTIEINDGLMLSVLNKLGIDSSLIDPQQASEAKLSRLKYELEGLKSSNIEKNSHLELLVNHTLRAADDMKDFSSFIKDKPTAEVKAKLVDIQVKTQALISTAVSTTAIQDSNNPNRFDNMDVMYVVMLVAITNMQLNFLAAKVCADYSETMNKTLDDLGDLQSFFSIISTFYKKALDIYNEKERASGRNASNNDISWETLTKDQEVLDKINSSSSDYGVYNAWPDKQDKYYMAICFNKDFKLPDIVLRNIDVNFRDIKASNIILFSELQELVKQIAQELSTVVPGTTNFADSWLNAPGDNLQIDGMVQAFVTKSKVLSERITTLAQQVQNAQSAIKDSLQPFLQMLADWNQLATKLN